MTRRALALTLYTAYLLVGVALGFLMAAAYAGGIYWLLAPLGCVALVTVHFLHEEAKRLLDES